MSDNKIVTDALLGDALAGAPAAVRTFFRSALRLDDLDRLYESARELPGDAVSINILRLLGVRVRVPPEDVGRIPATGAVIIVANHPFGLLDGLIVHALLAQVRDDVKVLANDVLARIPGVADRVFELDVFTGRKAVRANARAIRAALAWLEEGRALIVFPSGEVSHWHGLPARSVDPAWGQLPVRFARRAKVPIVPVFFEGGNSVAFHLSGLVHPLLRTARLPAELLNKRGAEITVRVGSPILPETLEAWSDESAATDYVRGRTYLLSHRRPVSANAPKHWKNPIEAANTTAVDLEIARLDAEAGAVVSNDAYAVYAARGESIPATLREIGRQRELTFRQAGEGTGESCDIDRFDRWYTHLTLWNKRDGRLAGGYRLAWTEDVLPRLGSRGLYTSTLFHFHREFLARLGSAAELGRSFICPEYQRDYAPLMLLWQAIARLVLRRPGSPVLFGPVSISADYGSAARALIVQFLREHHLKSELTAYVRPRRKFRTDALRDEEVQRIARLLRDLDDLDEPIRDMENKPAVPVLLRQYLRLGGKVAAFNLDRRFSDALDGLIVVDLRQTHPRILAKYMGAASAQEFLAAHVGAARPTP